MRTLITIACVAILGLTGCANGPATTSAQQVAVASDATDAGKSGATDAGTPGKIESTADAEDRVICRQITPTGSHRKKTICRKVSDIKRDRESAQDALRRSKGAGMQAPSDT